METATEKQQRLLKELEQVNLQIQNCRHEFGKPFKKSFVEKEARYAGIDYENSHGSDPEYKFTSSDKTVYKWARTCTICGLTEITEKTKVTETEPDFN